MYSDSIHPTPPRPREESPRPIFNHFGGPGVEAFPYGRSRHGRLGVDFRPDADQRFPEEGLFGAVPRTWQVSR